MSRQLGLGATAADLPELVSPEDTNAAMRVLEDKCWDEMRKGCLRFREWGLNIYDHPYKFVDYFTKSLDLSMARHAALCELRANIISDYTAYRINQAQTGTADEWNKVLADITSAEGDHDE